MDKFDEAMKSMAGMSPAQAADAMGNFQKICICPDCPTYTGCAKNARESLFCAVGKSFVCISKEEDCICPDCPITGQIGLKNRFYCTKGTEMTQRYAQNLFSKK